MRTVLSACWVLAATAIVASVGVEPVRAQSHAGQSSREQEIDRLIVKLGADSYASRTYASRRLREIGLAAEAQLRAAMKHPSTEVRARAERLLLILNTSSFQERVEAFAADTDGARNLSLPGWESFCRLVGSDANCRELFVKMQLAEPDILRVYESDPAEAAKMAAVRCSMEDAHEVGSAAAILLAVGNKHVERTEQMDMQIAGVLSRTEVVSAIKKGSYKQPLRALAGRWMGSASFYSSPSATGLLNVAFQLDLKEGIPLAFKSLKEDDVQFPISKFIAFATIAKVGNAKHIPRLAPLLDNSEILFQQKTPDGRHIEIQARDMALVAVVHLSGQKLADYGIDGFEQSFQFTFRMLQNPPFDNPQQRDKAIAKWRAWSKAHPRKNS